MSVCRSAALVAAMSLVAMAALEAEAQSVAPAVSPASAAASPPMSPAVRASGANRMLTYRSAFEGYRGYREQPLESWRGANERVGQIGGWQAYARESLSGAPAVAASGAASGAPAGAHSGHKAP